MANAEIQLFYIGTSKVNEIRAGGSVTQWAWGSTGSWHTFKKPTYKYKKNVKYNKTSKNKPGTGQTYKKTGTNPPYSGGKTVHGTYIPATATKTVSGVSKTVQVGYIVRGYTRYKRYTVKQKDSKGNYIKYTSGSKKGQIKTTKKMTKRYYDKAHPYQYKLIYKDDPYRTDTTYSTFVDGTNYIFFGSYYYKDGKKMTRTSWAPHPLETSFTVSDVRRNFDVNSNNGDNRDNSGRYVLSTVRANIMTIGLTWNNIEKTVGEDIVDTLNPSSVNGKLKNYLTVQYRGPSGSVKTGTFFPGERSVVKNPNGTFKEITVTLTEV